MPNYEGIYRIVGNSRRNNLINPMVAVLGEALTDARKRLKITQRELGKSMGLNQSEVSRIEGGIVEYGVDRLIDYLKGLGGATLRLRVNNELCQSNQERMFSSFSVVSFVKNDTCISTSFADITKTFYHDHIELDIKQKSVKSLKNM